MKFLMKGLKINRDSLTIKKILELFFLQLNIKVLR